MKKNVSLMIAWWVCTAAIAQQSLKENGPVVSPEIHGDRTITFRLSAPNAGSVQVTGDFLPVQKITTAAGEAEVPGVAGMQQRADGVWEYTTDPLPSELYCYSFLVDSLKVRDPGNVYMVRDISTVMNIFLVGGGRGDLYKVNAVPHGTVARVWYDSPSLGKQRRMTVYTPAGYEDSGRSYPVFYLLHGKGGDEEAWMSLGRASQIMDNLIAQGKAEPMIVVMTNGNVSQEAAPGESSSGLAAPVYQLPQTMEGTFEASFPDVVQYIDSHYRTLADKHHRAIAGLSMGGYHAKYISMHYPDMFDYVGLFSAAMVPGKDVRSPVYDDTEGKLKEQFARQPALYWIGIGDKDFLYQANAAYRRLLDANGYPYRYYETGEGHIWKNWRIYLSEFVPLLFK